jgi:hypothetical protein
LVCAALLLACGGETPKPAVPTATSTATATVKPVDTRDTSTPRALARNLDRFVLAIMSNRPGQDDEHDDALIARAAAAVVDELAVSAASG